MPSLDVYQKKKVQTDYVYGVLAYYVAVLNETDLHLLAWEVLGVMLLSECNNFKKQA